ncbi:copper-binding protein [Ralstonia pseudosolanacearum]|uniref:copper-binding protein n=1 Tax=Ralstonia pseudosolanacearum TaxID=1310165 RepID=UPI003AABC53A
MKHAITLSLLLAMASGAYAAGSMESMDMKPSTQTSQAAKPVAAEIKKIYLEAGKVTLKHGAIENLGMSAMTMTFPVKDAGSLKGLKEGDAVNAVFGEVNGMPTVLELHRR